MVNAAIAVNNPGDFDDGDRLNGVTTLREAIQVANSQTGDDAIAFDFSAPQTITLTSLLPIIDSNIAFIGTGANNLTISGNNQFQVFFVNSGVASFSDLAIANGRAQGGNGSSLGGSGGGGAAGLGGGLLINNGTVAVTDVLFVNNQAIGGNGGIGTVGITVGGSGGGFGGDGSTAGGNGGNFGGAGGIPSVNSPGGAGGPGAGGAGGFGAGGGSGSFIGGAGGFAGGGGGGGGSIGGGSAGGAGGFAGGGGGGGSGFFGNPGGNGGAGGDFAGNGGSGDAGSGTGGGGGGAGLGGAIFVNAGSLTLNNSRFQGNRADGGDGGTGVAQSGEAGDGKGGAIFINSAATVTTVGTLPIFSGNTATEAGTTASDNNNIFGALDLVIPQVSITASGNLTETGTTGTFTISRGSNTLGELVVNLGVNGSATFGPGNDYTVAGASDFHGSNGTVVIPEGSNSVTITVTVNDDIQAEAAESLALTLLPGTGYTIAPANVDTLTIAANDTVVTTTGDDGEGSLRQAIINANTFAGADTVSFDVAGNFATLQTIELTSGQLEITGDTTIAGTGANQLILDAGDRSRLFRVASGITVTLDGMTIRNGFANNGDGGGIFNQGTLTLSNSVVSNSAAEARGGGIFNSGTLTLTNSTLSSNQSDSNGGGIFNSGTLTLTNSTLSSNQSDSNGGGLANIGSTAVSTLTNSTLTGNQSALGGGIFSPTATTLSNTLIAGNVGSSAPDASGNFVSNGFNLIGNGANATGFTSADQVGTASAPISPLLSALGNHGGTTPTHALLPGSRAIDTGSTTATTDQRGLGRVGSADIGAFESQGFLLTPSGSLQSAIINQPFAAPLGVTVTSAIGEPVRGGQITFAAPTVGSSATLSSPIAIVDAVGQGAVSAVANAIGGTYVVTASTSGAAPGQFTLTNVVPTIALSPPNLPTAIAGVPYLQALSATGSIGTYAFAVTAGSLPAGLTLSPEGVISGTPTTAGAIALTIAATDSNGISGSQAYSLTTLPGSPGTIAPLPGTTPQATLVGTAFTTPLQVRVTDAFNNPIGGSSVVFTAPSLGASGSFADSLTFTASTDNNGVATAAPLIANSIAGSYTVLASLGGLSTSFNLSNNPLNTIPVILPTSQAAIEGLPLVFSTATGNPVVFGGVDTLEVSLAVSNGLLTLGNTANLTFTVGDGTADAALTFNGAIANINAALEGLSFVATDFCGAVNLQVTGSVPNSGGASSAGGTVPITVGGITLSGSGALSGTQCEDTLTGSTTNDTFTPKRENDVLTGGGGRDSYLIQLGDGTDTITDFGGVGIGIAPTPETIAEVDTLKFTGAGLTAENLLLTQVRADLAIAFEGVSSVQVTLQNFSLANFDNLGGSNDLNNIWFNGQTAPQDNLDVFDVFNADLNQPGVFNRDTVTFLNDLNNTVAGFDNSDDVINGQAGDDRLDGKTGDDLLRGGQGNDVLLGRTGGDRLNGGDGDDLLSAGPGRNTVTGGAGSDRFELTRSGVTDTITDFVDGVDQLILPSSTAFGDLRITQGAGNNLNNTLIRHSGSSEILAILVGLQSSLITAADFA